MPALDYKHLIIDEVQAELQSIVASSFQLKELDLSEMDLEQTLQMLSSLKQSKSVDTIKELPIIKEEHSTDLRVVQETAEIISLMQ